MLKHCSSAKFPAQPRQALTMHICRGQMTRLCAIVAACVTAIRADGESDHFRALGRAARAAIFAAGLAALSLTSFPTAEAQPAALHAHVGLQSLHPIVDEVMPAVVNVAVVLQSVPAAQEEQSSAPGLGQGIPELPETPFDQFLRRFFGDQGLPQDQETPQVPNEGVEMALGSGFIMDPQGYIVTNNHVVENAKSVTVVFQDNSRHPAKIIGRDPRTDLALLKIDTDKSLPYLQWGDSDTAQIGDWVMAVGNPFGLGGTVTAGIISARGRDIESGPYDDFLQIDAPINRGNSGGPTFDMDGNVIGINTAIFSPSGGSVGIGFAIPASIAKPVIDQLRATGKVERGWLGVEVQQISPEIAKSLGRDNQHGALVSTVTADSPAAKAGVKQGDVVLTFDNDEIVLPRDLSIAVAKAPIGKPATMSVWRDGKEITLQPMIAQMPHDLETAAGGSPAQPPPSQPSNALGLQFAPLTDNLRRQLQIPGSVKGVVVTNVAPDSPAADQIEPGDVIVAVNQQPVTSPEDAAAKLQGAQSAKKGALVLLNRKGTNLYVGLDVG